MERGEGDPVGWVGLVQRRERERLELTGVSVVLSSQSCALYMMKDTCHLFKVWSDYIQTSLDINFAPKYIAIMFRRRKKKRFLSICYFKTLSYKILDPLCQTPFDLGKDTDIPCVFYNYTLIQVCH